MSTWTIGGILMAALALAVILGFVWGRRRPAEDDQPLGLPEGSVRGIIAILVSSAVILCPFVGIEIPKPIESAFLIIIGLYFGSRAQQAAQRATRVPSGPSAGFAMPWTMGTLALAGVVIGAMVLLSGCTTGTMRTVQGGVNAVAKQVGGQRVVEGLQTFRDAEGRVYAETAGLISTQGLAMVTQLYALDEGRWITGRVIPRQRFIRDLPPIGDAPAVAAPAITNTVPAAEPPPANPPAELPPAPAAGPSLASPVNGSVVQ